MQFDKLSGKVIGCALEVHRALGPGLLESAYQRCLAHELSLAGIPFVLEREIPVVYKGTRIECGYRADMIVDGALLVELKSVDGIVPIHEAQILSYMKLAGIRTGLLLNFNVERLKDGIRRFVL